jgi:iron complex transport system substrate-binding protein
MGTEADRIMTHRWNGWLGALSCLAVWASAPALSQEAAKVADLSRIVAIGGDVTEILYALGYEPNIVAVDTTSVYPADALARKKNVGYMRAISTEGVLSLSPTVIIASEDAGPPEVVAALKQSSVPFVTIGGPDSASGAEMRIRAVAEAVGATAKGEKLAAEVRAKFEALAQKRAALGQPARLLFLMSVQNGRIVAGGRGTAAHEIVGLAGGSNVATGFDGYKPLSDEAALELAPDIILVMHRAQQPGAPRADPVEKIIAAMPGLGATPAARNGRIFEVDGAALLQFGPRSADAALDLMRILSSARQASGAGP